MGLLDPKPVSTTAIDGLVRDKINLAGSATKVALDATIAGKVDPLAARVPVAPSIGARAYDPRYQTYNFKPKHLRKTRALLANAKVGNSMCKITTIGTSIAAGQGVDRSLYSWPVYLRDLLAGTDYYGGTGQVPPVAGDSTIDPRWSTPGYSPFKINGFWTLFAFGTAAATFNSGGKVGNGFDLWYIDGANNFTVAIDGGAAVTVTATNTGNVLLYSATGLAATSHSVVITPVVGSITIGPAQIGGSTGIVVNNFGIGSAKASDFVCSTSGAGAMNFAYNDAPALVTINAMTNEAVNGGTVADFKANMLTVVQRMKAAGADVLLIGEIPANLADLTAYRTALYEIADSEDLPVLDMFDRWGSYTEGNTLGLYSDNYHGSKAGYRDYAQAVADLIIG